MSDIHEGGCLCGNVRYRVSGQPLRTLVCHCTFCQRFTGSCANVESIFAIDAVEFSGAEMGRYDHRSDSSGNLIHLHFCRTCGTTVSLTFERGPATRAICRGTFDDPNWVSITRNVWVGSAQTGIALPENIDCFFRASVNVDQTPAPATRFDAPVMATHMQSQRTDASGPGKRADPAGQP